HSQKQMLHRHVLVVHFAHHVVGPNQGLPQFGRDVWLCAAAVHGGQPIQEQRILPSRLVGFGTSSLQQNGDDTLGLIEQCLEQVLHFYLAVIPRGGQLLSVGERLLGFFRKPMNVHTFST